MLALAGGWWRAQFGWAGVCERGAPVTLDVGLGWEQPKKMLTGKTKRPLIRGKLLDKTVACQVASEKAPFDEGVVVGQDRGFTTLHNHA